MTAIVHGDILEVLDGMPSDAYDTVFADWPYSQMQPVRGKDVGAAGRIYGPTAFLFKLLTRLHRVASKGAHLYVFGDWRGIPDTGYVMSTTGWFPTTLISWDKCYVGTGGVWRSQWDPIWFATKGPADKRSDKALGNSFSVPSARGKSRRHPAEKPREVWEKLCAASVIEGTRVLDAFAGSGGSRAPVEALGGIWEGVDVDPRWAGKLVSP